jgi:recombination protein RecA
MQTAERDRLLGVMLQQLGKQFGTGGVIQLGTNTVLNVGVVPTGVIALDAALGVGGLPRGRVTEIFGPASAGKTTLALHAIAQAQAAGGVAAFVDAEHALDAKYARALGVNVETLIVAQPDFGEQALDITNALVASNVVDIVVVDSVAALVPKAEIEGEMGDSFTGLHARLMSQALRKLTASLARANACLVFINQIRERIGVMLGNPETTTGGRALQFYSSVRIDVRPVAAVKDGEQTVGNRTRIKIVKNKVASPFREVEVDILYGQGISREGNLLDFGAEQGVVEKSGSWYGFEGERVGQERENACRFLIENKAVYDRILKAVRTKIGLDRSGPHSGEESGRRPDATKTASA